MVEVATAKRCDATEGVSSSTEAHVREGELVVGPVTVNDSGSGSLGEPGRDGA